MNQCGEGRVYYTRGVGVNQEVWGGEGVLYQRCRSEPVWGGEGILYQRCQSEPVWGGEGEAI